MNIYTRLLCRNLFLPSALIILLSLLCASKSYAKDCEILIEYKKAIASTNTSGKALGLNEGESKNLSVRNLLSLTNKKDHMIQARITKVPPTPGSTTKWVTLPNNNYRDPLVAVYSAGVQLYQVKCPGAASTTMEKKVLTPIKESKEQAVDAVTKMIKQGRASSVK